MACVFAIHPRSGETAGTSRRRDGPLWAVFLLSSALIMAAARGDLWFDEIWSLAIAQAADSVKDIFVRFHSDNNHPLNTVFLFYVGGWRSFYLDRLLAVLSGIGSVFLVGRIAARSWGSQEAFCGMVLAGLSYPLLLYFSEARGYAPAVFFALGSHALLRENWQDPRLGRLALFWGASILGLLSHATFIMATMALCLGHLADEVRAEGTFRRKLLRSVAWHAPPLIFFAGWYVYFLRGMTIGEGPIYPVREVLAQASALLIGFPQLPASAGVAMMWVLVFVALGAAILRQESDAQWAFYLAILFLAPALLLIVARPKYLYFRYLIVCFPFFHLLFSHLVCRCYRSWARRWRWIPVATVALLVAAQTPRIHSLLSLGRGRYAEALAYIAEHSRGGVVRIGSDHDFRNSLMVYFYAPLVPGGARLQYVKEPQWRETPPDWILVHSQDLWFQPLRNVDARGIGFYRLANEYRFSGISGWSWFLFRRETLRYRGGNGTLTR
jgi:hypothetical protein